MAFTTTNTTNINAHMIQAQLHTAAMAQSHIENVKSTNAKKTAIYTRQYLLDVLVAHEEELDTTWKVGDKTNTIAWVMLFNAAKDDFTYICPPQYNRFPFK